MNNHKKNVIQYVHDGSKEGFKSCYISLCKNLANARSYKYDKQNQFDNRVVYAVDMPAFMETVEEERFYDFSWAENIKKTFNNLGMHRYSDTYYDLIVSYSLASSELIFDNYEIEDKYITAVP